jgi:hypothetical protein
MDSIITCDTKEELMPTQTDHFPIIKELNLAPELTNTTPKRNFRTTDWKKFSAALESKLQNLPMPKPIISKEEAQDRLDRLLEVITSTIEEKTPLSKPSPYAKRWWSAELGSANKNLKKIAYQAGQSPPPIQGRPNPRRAQKSPQHLHKKHGKSKRRTLEQVPGERRTH